MASPRCKTCKGTGAVYREPVVLQYTVPRWQNGNVWYPETVYQTIGGIDACGECAARARNNDKKVLHT